MCWKLPCYMAIAEEDITTYKTVWQIGENEYCSLMEWSWVNNELAKKGEYKAKYIYRIGQEVIMPNFQSNEEEYKKIANEGAPRGQFSTSRKGSMYFGFTEHIIVECVISKGTVYWYCDFDQDDHRINGERVYCSEKLYYKSIAVPCIAEKVEEEVYII